MKYFLSNSSYVCVTDGYAVFLDLKKDKYTALAPRDVQALESVVEGLSTRRPTESIGSDLAGMDLADELAREGLLTVDSSMGKLATPVDIERAKRALWSAPGAFPELTWSDIRNFLWAWMRVTVMLRCLPLRVVVDRVRRRRTRKKTVQFDAHRARRLTIAYLILQPNFFSPRDNCLRSALTLAEFLACYGLYPSCVFGVRMSPFVAHSWLQEGDMVLNDSVDHVRAFTPIMKA